MAKKAKEAPKKQIVITAQANDFIFSQPLPVVSAFMDVIHRLEMSGYLTMPDAKKIAADPALARRSARFSAALNRRQDAALAGLAQRPNSRAAKDYARVTGPAFA